VTRKSVSPAPVTRAPPSGRCACSAVNAARPLIGPTHRKP